MLILEAFRGFKGTIVSGGTTSGVSGLIGDVQQTYSNTIQTVGYVPKGKAESIDKRYTEIWFTDGNNFSPTELLQYWIDILASDIRVSDVKFLGINGGRISALEYKIALAFGASVGIIQNSGMEADRLLSDREWNTSTNLLTLTKDPKDCYSFIQTALKD